MWVVRVGKPGKTRYLKTHFRFKRNAKKTAKVWSYGVVEPRKTRARARKRKASHRRSR